MGWIALGAPAVAGGVLMFRAGVPGGRAHASIARSRFLGDLYATGCLVLTAAGAALVLKGLVDLAA